MYAAKTKRPRVLAVVTACLMLGITTTALAVDAKVLAGNACSPIGGTLTTFSQFLTVSNITAQNEGGFPIVSCPIVRDNTANTDGLDDLDVFVNSDDGIACTATSQTPSGQVLRSVTMETTGSGLQRIDFGTALGGAGASQVSNGMASSSSYAFFCLLDRTGESINEYRWDE